MDIAICDANILIDYSYADKSLIHFLTEYFEHVYVPDVVLKEVKDLNVEEAKALGLEVIDVDLSLEEISGLSIQDRVCLAFVNEHKCTCLTNDTLLRKHCERVGGKVVWGFEMLKLLVEAEIITKEYALEKADSIVEVNPWLPKEILERVQSILENC